ncbi:VRR-NUC domain-containing protein [Yersinia ruckeri]|uniref:VRR-NUC domain-containing protein n=1 Tax=Yersinia ruckeri TaxID=29486 RepID=UPI000BDED6AF|nr:VRR-NUC domain-containing protein [Yersinia ruckeri]MCK8538228.1 VRR-NUC domain-containing protein [Yersinia ruckeri]MCK8569974.1 VRR-NUC domain-containing protein [Yersinia ruckeri]MCK8573943.1 VRR-NUC domain-containing protein [Yersinia ruckeri]MCK8576724.1 VRR-NUC domain-containing protein [Yersinia ruckeri]MCK8580134.1 VRR-NUC domain-containing protein [Yersinia ruckeri]
MLNSIDAIAIINTKAKLEVRKGKVRKVNHQAETEEQAALIEWADKTVIDGICVGDYLIHIPNEGKRGPKAARDAKRLGLRKGVPDLFLALPRGGYAGLWIEMKALYGKPTTEQTKWIDRMIKAGFSAEVCKGFRNAKYSIEYYLTCDYSDFPNINI